VRGRRGRVGNRRGRRRHRLMQDERYRLPHLRDRKFPRRQQGEIAGAASAALRVVNEKILQYVFARFGGESLRTGLAIGPMIDGLWSGFDTDDFIARDTPGTDEVLEWISGHDRDA